MIHISQFILPNGRSTSNLRLDLAPQNERTLFSFLYEVDLDKPVKPADLYDYFAPVMRADTSVGGTYRQWLETESALTKSLDGSGARVLKAVCLQSLGTSGERSRAGQRLLRFAVSAYAEGDSEEVGVVQGLIGRKLLLYRRHSDQVAVWHGTDFDLRRRLEEEKRRQEENFSWSFLNEEAFS